MAYIFDTILMDVATIVIIILSIQFLRYYYAFKYWKNKNVPYITPISIFGNMHDSILQRESVGESLKRFYCIFNDKPFFGLYFGKKPALILRDPEHIKQFLVKDFPSFHDRTVEVNEKANPLGANLLFLRGERWRSLRAKLTPTFTSGKIKLMFNAMNKCADDLNNMLIDIAKEKQEIDIKDVSAKFFTDIIGTCAFGFQCNAIKNPHSEFHEMGRRAFKPTLGKIIRRFLIQTNPVLVKLLGLSVFDKKVTKFFTTVVRENVKYRENNNFVRNDFLQLLIDLKNKGEIEDECLTEKENSHPQKGVTNRSSIKLDMTDDFLAAQCFSFFLAGSETSSDAMSFCLYELALNPDIQHRLREEVNDVLSQHGGKLTYEAVQNMEYLSKVVDETLRKHPPVPILARACTKPFNIPGTSITIDQKVNVYVPACALHHDPQYFPEPDKFDPERFTEDVKRSRHHYTYLPFGEGPRNCIGVRFGLIQTKVGLARLISKYQFSPCKKTEIPLKIDPRSGVIVAPIGDIWLTVSYCNDVE